MLIQVKFELGYEGIVLLLLFEVGLFLSPYLVVEHDLLKMEFLLLLLLFLVYAFNVDFVVHFN